MAGYKLPPAKLLRQLFDYEASTGKIRHKEGYFAGQLACDTLTYEGYRRGAIRGRVYFAHRIIWKMLTGREPNFVDHINGDKSDNRIENLRAVSKSENARNRPIPSNNTSGCIGVSWSAQHSLWSAYIGTSGTRHQKYFRDKSDAVSWRKDMEAKFDFHPNHGRTARG